MMRYVFFLILVLSLSSAFTTVYGDDGGHGEHAMEMTSIMQVGPLAVDCGEEEAVETNIIDCDRDRFMPDCVKISLSNDPVITWKSFDFVRHNVVVLKDGVPFAEKAVGTDVTNADRERFPDEFTYNFETGEFLGRPNGELRNINDELVSPVNTGVGEYIIWCRYHAVAGMTMRLFVVE